MARHKVCRPRKSYQPPPIPPYMVPPKKPQVASPIIVEGVASAIHARMGDVLDEVARRDIRCKPVIHNVHRSSLLSMCLVSKEWAETCQRILRRRVVIPSVEAMKSFLQNRHQGPYVLELIYFHDTDDLYNYENPHGKSHWLLLAELLDCLPNLRALCVDIRDCPEDEEDEEEEDEDEDDGGDTESDEEGDESEEEKGGSDPDSKIAFTGEHENKDAENTNSVPPSSIPVEEELEEVEPEDFEEHLEKDRQRGMGVEVDFTGIRAAFRAIGRLSNLKGLVLLADFIVDITSVQKIMRFCPYFIEICEQLPKLTNLTYLRIRGFSSDHEEEGFDSFTGGEIITNNEQFPDILVGISPPPSLKTLIVELPTEWIPYNAVMWLVKPQGASALENLLIKYDDEDVFEAMICLSRKFDTPMPQLSNFRFEFPDDGTMLTAGSCTLERARDAIATSFLKNMPSLRSLHIPPALCGATLPDALEDLVFLYEYEVDPGEYYERPDWFKRDMALVSVLRNVSLPSNVKEVTIAVTNEQGSGASPGTDDMEYWLPMTQAYCEEEDIDVNLVEDHSHEDRMADFLLCGRIGHSSEVTSDSRRERMYDMYD